MFLMILEDDNLHKHLHATDPPMNSRPSKINSANLYASEARQFRCAHWLAFAQKIHVLPASRRFAPTSLFNHCSTVAAAADESRYS